MRRFLVVTICVFAMAWPVLADERPAATFRIAIEVTVSDDELKGRVAKYFRNELRRLGDVEVTTENPHFKIYALVSQMRTDRSTRIAYILGTSVTSFFPDGYFAIPEGLGEETP